MDTINFSVDLIWVTRFMIQRAHERFIQSIIKVTPHQFVLRPYKNGDYMKVSGEFVSNFTRFGKDQDDCVAEITYNSSISTDMLLETYEDAWVVNEQFSYYPKFVINLLNELYTNLPDNIIDQILQQYITNPDAILINSNTIDITASDKQADDFYKIAREVLKDSERSKFLYELNAYVSPYEYSVLDIRTMKEYQCDLGNHWETFAKIINKNYKSEFKELTKLNNINIENSWILKNFKFNGKFGGNDISNRGETERNLYTKRALR